MNLEDYFDFISETDIRIKGTRIGIETILYEYIFREQHAEAIQQQYPSLTLEQVYATILYYHRHRNQLKAYMNQWLEQLRQNRIRQQSEPPSVVKRISGIKKKKHTHITSR